MKKIMTEIEKTLEISGVRPTAMRMLIYKFMAQKEVAVALTDIENAFAKPPGAHLQSVTSSSTYSHLRSTIVKVGVDKCNT
jgi:Fe2+ or Zn2+ uptake regulation protein